MNILKINLSNASFQLAREIKLLLGLCFLGSISFLAYGADDLAMTEWKNYGNTLKSTKYSPLEQINSENVNDLKIAWMWDTPDNEIFQTDTRATSGPYKITPIMVNGVLYVTTSLGVVAAVDAKTGEQLWQFDTESWTHGRHPNFNNSHRGVSYWSNGEQARILMPANDAIFWSLDAETGLPDPEFGEGGSIDLRKGLGRDFEDSAYGVVSPPLVINDTVVVGSSISDGPRNYDDAPPGHVRAFALPSGELKWQFNTIPQAGEYGVESWEDDSWQYSGATNVWTLMSADPELGYIYMPTGTPTNDWYGGHRLGDNLFAESLICIDAETGERVWHFQMVHHGIWDYDLPAAPVLADIEVDGKLIKAVAQTSKQGFVYVFDRENGEPVWPIVEQPVPASKIFGERLSPTQPIPTKPAPFEAQGISDATLIDFTDELRAEALEIISDLDYGPLFTPLTERGTIIFPGYSGGSNWTGGALDPDTNIFYLSSVSVPRYVRMIRPEDPEVSNFTYDGERFNVEGPQGLPIIKPPYSRITAIDLDSGEHEWMIPHGEGMRQRIIDMGIEDPGPVGSYGRNGPLLTKSLLFFAQFDNGKSLLRAYNKATGEIISELEIPLPAMGTPMTYAIDGKQYIAMAVGAGPDTKILALALP